MARLVDHGTLTAYRLFSGAMYHVSCGEKAEYKEGPTLSGDDRWACKKCDAPDSPWHTDFTLNRAKERGLMSVTKTWVLLDSSDIAEEIFKLDLHVGEKATYENTYYYIREATVAEKCQWWHKKLTADEKAKG